LEEDEAMNPWELKIKNCKLQEFIAQTAGLPCRRPLACAALADWAVGDTADRRSALRCLANLQFSIFNSQFAMVPKQ